jgi:cytoskeleton protein RodZ
MSEANGESGVPRSAGTLLREARQAQGLHIAALAASIKVAQRKLEALEADRFEELPDATFARALAQTVCRALKIDPAPVLALLPAPAGNRLGQGSGGINQPFRERPGRSEPKDWSIIASPGVWGPALLVVGAALLYFWPASWLADWPFGARAPTAGGPATVESGSPNAASVVMPPPPLAVDAASAAAVSTPASDVPAASPSSSAAAPVGAASAPVLAASGVLSGPAGGAALHLHTTAPSWIEVQDARSKLLVARTVQAGESLALDGEAPLRVKIGNAGATALVFRGQPLDLAASTRDNVARLELK